MTAFLSQCFGCISYIAVLLSKLVLQNLSFLFSLSSFLAKKCRDSKGLEKFCSFLAKKGYCESQQSSVKGICRRTCNLCCKYGNLFTLSYYMVKKKEQLTRAINLDNTLGCDYKISHCLRTRAIRNFVGQTNVQMSLHL